jgi:hypothetical protein
MSVRMGDRRNARTTAAMMVVKDRRRIPHARDVALRTLSVSLKARVVIRSIKVKSDLPRKI